MRYKQLMVPVLGRQTLWLLLAFFLTLGMGKNMAMAAAPVNDMFIDATPISEMTGTIAGTTVEATAEPGEPDHDNDPMVSPPHHSIWYQWTAPGSGTEISFYTSGSSFDTVLAVYTGTSLTGLTRVASNDDDVGVVTSKVKFTPTPGAIYYIAIDGYAADNVYELNSDYGTTVLSWVPVSAMATYTLIVDQTGTGTGTVTGGGTFEQGTATYIYANAATGSTFTGWSGDCTGTDSPLYVVMDADKTCTATFTLNTYILTVNVNPAGSGTGVFTGGGTYDYGTTQEISATADTGSTFIGWSGDCTGTVSPLSVLIDANKTCTATFNLNTDTRTLIVNQIGKGTVTGGGTYVAGTTQEITATADTGSTFTGWSGDCTGTDSPLSVVMDADKICTATFTPNTRTLTVSKSGTGTGTVTSTPSGIDCGNDCSEVYDIATQITLTATTDADNTFIGWLGGNCTGTQDCTVTMDADITITAIFKKNFPWPMFLPAITKGIQ